MRIVSEWSGYDAEIKQLWDEFYRNKQEGFVDRPKKSSVPSEYLHNIIYIFISPPR